MGLRRGRDLVAEGDRLRKAGTDEFAAADFFAAGFDPDPRLLGRALRIEANARPNLASVRGPGRSSAWADFLDGLDRPPLFPDCP